MRLVQGGPSGKLLDILLTSGRQVVIPDAVVLEATWNTTYPDADVTSAWIKRHVAAGKIA